MSNQCPAAVPEAVTCVALGIRTAVSPKLLAFSAGLWFGAMALWGLVLLFALSAVKSVAAFFTAWMLLGVFVVFPSWLPASAQAKIAGVPLSTGAEALLGATFHVITWVVLVVMVLALVIITVRIALEFLLMPLVRGEVLKRYPAFPARPSLGLLAPVKNLAKTWLLAVVIGLPCLLIPVLNAVLLLVLFGYLNVRTLVNEALDGLATPEEQRRMIKDYRWHMMVAGSLLAGAMTIPLVGFIGPSWTGASTCQICLRALLRLRSEEQGKALAEPSRLI